MWLGFCNQVLSISLNPKKLHKVFFLKPQPPPTKEEFFLHFLYAFGFCNQENSLAPTLKILLVFLCEVIANQLQQSKDCYGVSHVLGFMQRSQSCTRIHAKDQSQIGGLCIKGKKATTRSSPTGYWSKGSIVGWYFEIGQVSMPSLDWGRKPPPWAFIQPLAVVMLPCAQGARWRPLPSEWCCQCAHVW